MISCFTFRIFRHTDISRQLAYRCWVGFLFHSVVCLMFTSSSSSPFTRPPMAEVISGHDIVLGRNFWWVFKQYRVFFFQDGELLYMGLRGADMVCSDLRLKSHHIVSTFEQCSSVGWIRILRSQPNLLLSENFCGEVQHFLTIAEFKVWAVTSHTFLSFYNSTRKWGRCICCLARREIWCLDKELSAFASF